MPVQRLGLGVIILLSLLVANPACALQPGSVGDESSIVIDAIELVRAHKRDAQKHPKLALDSPFCKGKTVFKFYPGKKGDDNPLLIRPVGCYEESGRVFFELGDVNRLPEIRVGQSLRLHVIRDKDLIESHATLWEKGRKFLSELLSSGKKVYPDRHVLNIKDCPRNVPCPVLTSEKADHGAPFNWRYVIHLTRRPVSAQDSSTRTRISPEINEYDNDGSRPRENTIVEFPPEFIDQAQLLLNDNEKELLYGRISQYFSTNYRLSFGPGRVVKGSGYGDAVQQEFHPWQGRLDGKLFSPARIAIPPDKKIKLFIDGEQRGAGKKNFSVLYRSIAEVILLDHKRGSLVLFGEENDAIIGLNELLTDIQSSDQRLSKLLNYPKPQLTLKLRSAAVAAAAKADPRRNYVFAEASIAGVPVQSRFAADHNAPDKDVLIAEFPRGDYQLRPEDIVVKGTGLMALLSDLRVRKPLVASRNFSQVSVDSGDLVVPSVKLLAPNFYNPTDADRCERTLNGQKDEIRSRVFEAMEAGTDSIQIRAKNDACPYLDGADAVFAIRRGDLELDVRAVHRPRAVFSMKGDSSAVLANWRIWDPGTISVILELDSEGSADVQSLPNAPKLWFAPPIEQFPQAEVEVAGIRSLAKKKIDGATHYTVPVKRGAQTAMRSFVATPKFWKSIPFSLRVVSSEGKALQPKQFTCFIAERQLNCGANSTLEPRDLLNSVINFQAFESLGRYQVASMGDVRNIFCGRWDSVLGRRGDAVDVAVPQSAFRNSSLEFANRDGKRAKMVDVDAPPSSWRVFSSINGREGILLQDGKKIRNVGRGDSSVYFYDQDKRAILPVDMFSTKEVWHPYCSDMGAETVSSSPNKMFGGVASTMRITIAGFGDWLADSAEQRLLLERALRGITTTVSNMCTKKRVKNVEIVGLLLSSSKLANSIVSYPLPGEDAVANARLLHEADWRVCDQPRELYNALKLAVGALSSAERARVPLSTGEEALRLLQRLPAADLDVLIVESIKPREIAESYRQELAGIRNRNQSETIVYHATSGPGQEFVDPLGVADQIIPIEQALR